LPCLAIVTKASPLSLSPSVKSAGVTLNVIPARDDATNCTRRDAPEVRPPGAVPTTGMSTTGGLATYDTGAVGSTVTFAVDCVRPMGITLGSNSTVTPDGSPPGGVERVTSPSAFVRTIDTVNSVDAPCATRCSDGEALSVSSGVGGGATNVSPPPHWPEQLVRTTRAAYPSTRLTRSAVVRRGNTSTSFCISASIFVVPVGGRSHSSFCSAGNGGQTDHFGAAGHVTGCPNPAASSLAGRLDILPHTSLGARRFA